MDDKTVLHNYLKSARRALLWKLEGLSDYDLRRPLTATGTNLLGVLKHIASVEMGYFTSVFNRPCDVPLPWFEDGAEPNADMWATADETYEQMVALYHRSWELSDATIEELPLDAKGYVPWWPEDRREPTLHTALVHQLSETNRHLGQIDILREMIDESAGHREGVDNMADVDADWWPRYYDRLEHLARSFRGDGPGVAVRDARLARPARDLAATAAFYTDVVGLARLGGFVDHDGLDGVFIGPPGGAWHLELTHHTSGEPVPTPTDDDLLVLYVSADEAATVTARVSAAGHPSFVHPNPYWANVGAFCHRDPDGYVLVICPE